MASALIVAIRTQQRRLIYFPTRDPVPSAAAYFPGGRDVVLDTEDGKHLGAWYLTAPIGKPGPAVVVFNGNGGDRSGRAMLAVGLQRLGMSVLLFDYRGYGGNDGTPSEKGLAADARAAQAWLAAQPEVDPDRIVYFGESLGAAVAIGLSLERPPAALVLRSPFTSLAEVGKVHYPWLPVGWFLLDRFPSIDRIGSVTAPVMVVAGDRDDVVPEPLSKKLYDAAPDPKRYLLVPGTGHNDLVLAGGDRVMDEVGRFLSEAKVL
ncbi:alpha/beta hydrolase [Mycobacterium sp. ITM-2016-00318]|uniref:alpha/beta hydrolase n=1 Tax=Mycobacterium sp. ITM-2016-00318 TaxID=2099693 RepID=UPI000CF8B96E|nr:alpha/beta hydrolase [Mycobacterium sp. ITM-2016-00318]WNG93483.1 alpha/beta hydrolase [Mycobacterium sp. ITM-2016-00318]